MALPWRLLLWTWLVLAAGASLAAPVQEIVQAEFLPAEGEVVPPDSAPWKSQALPDAWAVGHSELNRSDVHGGWYRLRFRFESTPQPVWAVYLPKLGLNAAVYLNGNLIGRGGAFQEPVGRNWNRPLLFLMPPALMQPGTNTLHIHLLSSPYTQANLSPVLVGPEAELRQRFEGARFWRITLNQSASLIIASMGFLMLLLWWQRRQDVAYGYFGISALIWAAQSTNLYLAMAPLPTAAWEIIINSSFQVFSAFLLVSLLRFSGAGGKPLIPLLWLSAVASPLSQVLAPAHNFLAVTAFWHVYTLVGAIAVLLLLLRAAVRWHSRDAGLMAGAMGLVVLLAGHDWFMHSQHFWRTRPTDFLEDVYLLHYSAPLVFLAVGAIMTSRFVQVLNEFEALNDELESRVRAKHVELQESYARMGAMETEQAISEERERIYRDLHDDVGAKLLSLVYRAEKPENADLARSALQDLRDVVSTTQQDNLTLGMACADWRAECEQRLVEAGIPLQWRQTGPLDEFQLTQPQALNLGRILREAVSNLIKHAQASQVWVEVTLAEDHGLELRIHDDGIGHQGGPAVNGGRGLRNMRSRAERIGGTLEFASPESGGYEVRLVLPAKA